MKKENENEIIDLTDAQKRYDRIGEALEHGERKAAVDRWRTDRDFYFSKQWETEEARDMDETGQVDVVINKIRRVFKNFVSDMVARKPTIQLMPADAILEGEKGEAVKGTIEALQGLWDYCWRISDGVFRLRRAIFHQIISGLGWIGVYIDHEADFGRGEVKFREAPPWEIVVDLTANEPDLSDSKFLCWRQVLNLEDVLESVDKKFHKKIKLEAYLPKDDDDLDTMMVAPDNKDVKNVKISDKESSSIDGSRVVEVLEIEEKMKRDSVIYKVETSNGTFRYVFDEKSKYFDNEDLFRQDYDFVELNIKTDDSKVTRINKILQIGRNVVVEEEVLPTTSFTWVPLIDEDTATALPVGEVHFQRPMQKLLNKLFSLAMLTLQTHGVGAKIIGKKGVFGDTAEDIAAFTALWSNPQAIVELELRSEETIRNSIEVVQPSPLPPALSESISFIVEEMNDNMGYHPGQSGVFQDVPRTAQATSEILDRASINTRIPMQNIEIALSRVSERWLEFSLSHYNYQKSFSSYSETMGRQMMFLNWMKEDSEEDIYNELSQFNYSVFATLGSSSTSNRNAMLATFKEMMSYDPYFFKLYLQYSDIPNKFKIIEEFDELNQLRAESEEMKVLIDEMTKSLETSEDKIKQLGLENELDNFRRQLQNILTKARERTRTNEIIQKLQLKEKKGQENG